MENKIFFVVVSTKDKVLEEINLTFCFAEALQKYSDKWNEYGSRFFDGVTVNMVSCDKNEYALNVNQFMSNRDIIRDCGTLINPFNVNATV